VFNGVSAYLEALLPHVTAPLLEKVGIVFSNQLTTSIPHLQQFTVTTEKLRVDRANLTFDEESFSIRAYPSGWNRIDPFYMRVGCRHLNWQVASLAQISDALRTVLSAVEHLTLEYWRSSISSEWHHEADRSQWRELLRPFSKVKILVVPTGLVGELSLFLQLDDGESPMMLLPELKRSSIQQAMKLMVRSPHSLMHAGMLVTP